MFKRPTSNLLNQRTPRRKIILAVVYGGLCLALATAGLAWWYFQPTEFVTSGRMRRLHGWIYDAALFPEWGVEMGEICGDGVMLMPSTGLIGVEYGDSFRPGHRHSGFDIFSPTGQENVTPIIAAYDGYLTREANWFSTVIIQHPDFTDAHPDFAKGETLWTYYTHMASADGTTSFVSEDFPAGTYNQFVEAGTVLGYQGRWSGDPDSPTGLHLHFSIVKSTPDGGYMDETDYGNTLDPLTFLGVTKNAEGVLICQ